MECQNKITQTEQQPPNVCSLPAVVRWIERSMKNWLSFGILIMLFLFSISALEQHQTPIPPVAIGGGFGQFAFRRCLSPRCPRKIISVGRNPTQYRHNISLSVHHSRQSVKTIKWRNIFLLPLVWCPPSRVLPFASVVYCFPARCTH